MKYGTLETSTGFRFPTDWVGKNVKMILENQVYLEHMVSHKAQTKSFKNKKLVPVPKEEWSTVQNTHEPIIDEGTFELVQKFISVKKQPNKTGSQNIFAGLVKCPDCGQKEHGVFQSEWKGSLPPLPDLRKEQQSLHKPRDLL